VAGKTTRVNGLQRQPWVTAQRVASARGTRVSGVGQLCALSSGLLVLSVGRGCLDEALRDTQSKF